MHKRCGKGKVNFNFKWIS